MASFLVSEIIPAERASSCQVFVSVSKQSRVFTDSSNRLSEGHKHTVTPPHAATIRAPPHRNHTVTSLNPPASFLTDRKCLLKRLMVSDQHSGCCETSGTDSLSNSGTGSEGNTRPPCCSWSMCLAYRSDKPLRPCWL